MSQIKEVELSVLCDLEENKAITEEPVGKRNKQILKEQMKMVTSQEAHLDDITDIAGKMKKDGYEIREELKEQKRMLEELDRELAKTTSIVRKADLKLRRMIYSSSKCWLWLIIIFEVLSLLLIYVLM